MNSNYTWKIKYVNELIYVYKYNICVQQQRYQKVYKFIEAKQLTTEWKIGQGRNKEENLKLFIIE